VGCGYNMHPHHNFIICAFVLEGELTHVNTAGEGTVDQLRQGDYYVFSAGSGGKHCELSISPENMHAIYLWLMPNQLYLPPTYHRAHFDLRTRRNRIVQLVGDSDGALPVAQDLRVSRLVTDRPGTYTYTPRSPVHGVYVFVKESELRCGTPRSGLGTASASAASRRSNSKPPIPRTWSSSRPSCSMMPTSAYGKRSMAMITDVAGTAHRMCKRDGG